MSAKTIIDTAPLGALIRYTDGSPKPPARFTKKLAAWERSILVTIMRSHSADSRLIFEVAEEPKPGQVRVLLDFGGNTELLHLAESVTAAELWIAREGYSNARIEIVDAEDGDREEGADLAA